MGGSDGSHLADLAGSAIDELESALDLARWGASRFAEHELCFAHGTDNAFDESLHLVLHALYLSYDVERDVLLARLTRAERESVVALLLRRIEERIPASYITQRAWFAGLEFFVDERVLIPRSPIAECIERQFEPWIDSSSVSRIAELGTGSGCIAVALAIAFEGCEVDAVDNSLDAVAVAQHNVANYGLDDRVRVLHSDWFEALDGRYDLIVTNPPYVDACAIAALAAEFQHEPLHALAAGVDGLDCARSIIAKAGDYLEPDGVLVIEVGESQDAFANEFSALEFAWMDFERGGDGVALIHAGALADYVCA